MALALTLDCPRYKGEIQWEVTRIEGADREGKIRHCGIQVKQPLLAAHTGLL